jgi:predicted Zn-dependent protease
LTLSSLPLEKKADAYQQLISSESGNPVLLLRFGEILLRLKRYAEAEKQFRKVINLNYESAAPYNGLAAIYFEQNKFGEARRMLTAAVNKKVADGETYYNLAEFFLNEGLRDKASEYYDLSMRLECLPAYYGKARMEQAAGNSQEARRLVEEAKKLQ